MRGNAKRIKEHERSYLLFVGYYRIIFNQEGDNAMNRLEVLLKEYASADETGRLHLFLAHREFRGSFIRIDLEGLSCAAKKRAARPIRRWLDRFHSKLDAV
jgi:hypothetical protein